MSDSGPPDPLARLGERIDEARGERAGRPAGRASLPGGAVGIGFRIGIELVAALCVGLALGWVFDRAFGTRPWGLIVFFFLGSAAGILNAIRAMMGMGGAPPGRRG